MNTRQLRIAHYSKGIIYICLCAFIIAGAVTHQFDPFHPKLVTRECIQAPLLCSDDLKWFSVAVIGLFLIRHLLFIRRTIQSVTNAPAYEYVTFPFIRVSGHPVLSAIRGGRIQRLTYN